MRFGLSDSIIEKLTGVFKRFHEIDKVVIYGSRAKGNYKKGSDIDLTLLGEGLTTDFLDKISIALDDLLLPNMIDLSIYDQIENANLREHIERVGMVFFDKMTSMSKEIED